jgi:serine/threonine-protein kinase
MSPEQATADPRVDHRSDQYALGCVLYEMLAGVPPFTGPTSQAIMARHTADPVPSLRTVRAVPPELESTIVKALAKVPADRWPSVRTFAESLADAPARHQGSAISSRRVAVAGVGSLVIAIAALLTVDRGGNSSVEARPTLQRVAVLPSTFTGDSQWAGLADGLDEALFTGFTRVEGLAPVGGSRTQPFRNVDPLDAARQLDVENVVSTDVRVSENRVRVTAQLTPARGGSIWRQDFTADLSVNGKLQHLFDLQDTLKVRIVSALLGELTALTRAAVVRGVLTRDSAAYNLYLQAKQASSSGTLAGFTNAVSLYRAAINRDSTFADAWAALAVAIQAQDMWQGRRPVEQMLAGRTAAQKAIDLDPQNAVALAERGWWRAQFDWEWSDGRRDMREAVRLAPASADIAGTYAAFLNFVNEPDSALFHARRAVELDPTSPGRWSDLGGRLYIAGMPDSARAAFRRAIEMDSTSWGAYPWLIHVYLDVGFADSAAAAAKRVRDLDGEMPNAIVLAAYYRRAGDLAGAQAHLARLRALSRTQYVTPTTMATALLAVGDRAGALRAVEQAADEHDLELPGSLHFWLRPLDGEPRFEAVRQRVWGSRPVPRVVIP